MHLLKINHISKHYGQQEVLKDIDFKVNEYDITCLLGKSGSGKTTLFNLIANIETADSGFIDYHQKAKRIAYMQQKDLLLPYQKIIDNVMMPMLIKGVKKEIAKERGINLLRQVGLEGVINKYPGQLSGGMRQRVAFVRTLMTESKLALLDEPFSALDAMTRLQLQQWYMDMAREYGLTTLLITHDIDEALLLANNIFVLKDGVIVFQKILPKDKTSYIKSTDFLNDKYELLHVIG
ncbi:ABC transporter ATP-binding protein [Carnobacteriaceae bacterium zg-84]|uniref:ABC transporter ATP-binding protein n=1 Tax=Granulicatella sp. zg-84 TaxID=2678503 RepID=UPI0013C0E369|nr:ABC transporter ATP-binding protein [Granulicatella sp. zg-84]NEW66342.1 ATP-binding cassette domain-containing protein [Granulicatella sp. zg-84]QMI86482.1 ABC transporter ATP-binding protein [Carnobacteriaceae bacterium zg-84]